MEEPKTIRSQLLCELTGHFFLGNFFFLVALGWLGFYFSISISPLHYPASLLLSFAYIYFINHSTNNFFSFKTLLILIFSYCLFSLLLLYCLTFVYDISWDGPEYHQSAIIELKHGWNPLKNPFQGVFGQDLYVTSYAKASWVAEASLYAFYGNIQSAKFLHFILLTAAGFLTAGFLLKLKKINKLTVILLSLCVVFNPITISQFFTFYLDGILYLCMVCMILLCIQVFREGSKLYLLLGLFFCIHLISTLKFTGLIYACALSFFFILSFLITRQYKKTISLSILFLCMHLSVLATTGYNPYITNTLQHKHPFYPLNEVAIPACSQIPANFCDQNRVYTFVYSLFARTQNIESPYNAALKIPFTYRLGEVSTHPIADARTGGFGLWFSGILLLSCFLVYDTLKATGYSFRSVSFWLIYLLVALIISVLINPHPWWARYVPQFYLFPFIILIGNYLTSTSKTAATIRKITLVALLLNCYLTFEGTARKVLPASLHINKEIDYIKNTGKSVVLTSNRLSINARLTDQSIPVILSEDNLSKTTLTDTLSYLLPVQTGYYYLK